MSRVYQSYYTKSEPIVQSMISMLDLREGMRILDPCGGDGVFVDAVLRMGGNQQVDVYEVDPCAYATLIARFGHSNKIVIKHADALTCEELSLFADLGGVYDRIIANPPYGAWQEYQHRARLKELYPGFYVKETYALFLVRALQLLKEGGQLVFIVPETFLSLHRHKKLREQLLTESEIVEVKVFPSSFFPDVAFGYARLSIITLRKCTSRQRSLANSIRVVTGFRAVEELSALASHHRVSEYSQTEIFENPDHALLLTSHRAAELIATASGRIGDIADCVTGFYSGDDKRHLRASPMASKRAAKYEEVPSGAICQRPNVLPDILDGVDGPQHFVAVVKGGGIPYYKPDLWYMDWSKSAVAEYKSSRKARFQNSRYYFRQGIGVPMVSSRQITAALMDHRLFDQSIVGVFPHNVRLTSYLLAFFNSPTCNTLIRSINPSANNSANYIKKIPFIHPEEEELDHVNKLVAIILGEAREGRAIPTAVQEELRDLFRATYGC